MAEPSFAVTVGVAPTNAVRSSVVVEDVAVAFWRPDVLVVRGIPDGKLLEAPTTSVTPSLGAEAREMDEIGTESDIEACAIMHGANRAKGRRDVIKGGMGREDEMTVKNVRQ